MHATAVMGASQPVPPAGRRPLRALTNAADAAPLHSIDSMEGLSPNLTSASQPDYLSLDGAPRLALGFNGFRGFRVS